MRRGFKSAALERVVPDITEQRTGVGAGPVNKRCNALGIVGDQQLGHHRFFPGSGVPECHEHECPGNKSHQQLHGDDGIPGDTQQQEHQERVPELDLFLCLSLVGGYDLLTPACCHGPDHRVIIVIRVRIDKNVLQFLLWQELCHRLCQHGLPGTRAPDHHDMPALDSGFFNDLNCMFLTDDLIYESGWDLNL